MSAGLLPTDTRFSDILFSPLEFNGPLGAIVQERSAMLDLAVAAPGSVVGQRREVIRDDQIIFFIGPGSTRHGARLKVRCVLVINGFAKPAPD